MKFYKSTLVAFMFSVLGLSACMQEKEEVVKKEDISQQTLDQIHQLGFGTKDVKKIEEGYLVEGDIVLTEEQLNDSHKDNFLRVGKAEQYRTINLVGALPRRLRVGLSPDLPSSYVAAVDEAVARFNSQNLLLTFVRVPFHKADIAISDAPATAPYLASAGFPSSKGNAYRYIKINSTYLGANPGKDYLATILAHEIGHCIGFRHTDYMDRSFSCGGTVANEGASTVGAIHIPGTPGEAVQGSWMLACISNGQDRPFSTSDKAALDYLY